MRYRDAVEFLYSLQLFGARFGLERALRLARLAGNPQERLRFIHVAGTNGKGSTCAMLESIYRAAGWRAGLYTSPHLVSFRERIQVNRELIAQDDVIRLLAEGRRWLGTFPADDPPTFFEVVTVMALRHFAEQGCDVVIWETGLGGRLDATNIVTPLASVITNVQLDHEKWLGDTLAKIASEKAGIIKPRVPVITAETAPEALDVIRETAAGLLAPLHVVHGASALQEGSISIGLAGEHQRVNAALAIRTVEVLGNVLPASDEAIRSGLAHVEWPGRFQILRRRDQTFVLDGAHNPAGARALLASLQSGFGGRRFALVLGVLQDKDWRAVCETLAPAAARIVVAPVANSRTANPQSLAAACRQANPEAALNEAPSLRAALGTVTGDGLVLITGSLYFVGEALELLGLGPDVGERALNEWHAPAVR